MGYVVTGGGKGVGRAVVERLGGTGVVVIDVDSDALRGIDAVCVVGDAADPDVAEEAARLAAPLAGWVNNAAVFRDAVLHEDQAAVRALIGLNLDAALVGSATAVRHFLKQGTPGAIVNVSSHQAMRPVPGSLPYATAKAAIEGLTRAIAVDYGPHGIRANAVALGTIETGREDARRMGGLHALERIGRPEEAAAAIAYLLSDEASFISGATIPVDGGRSVLAREP